jgi:hypothetical protein
MQISSHSLAYTQGNPKSGFPRSDDDDVRRAGGIIWSTCWLESEVERHVFFHVKTWSLSGMAQRCLGSRRVLTDERRAGVLSSVVVAPTTCLIMSMLDPILKMGRQKMVAATSGACATVCVEGHLYRLCSQFIVGRVRTPTPTWPPLHQTCRY